MTDIGSGQVQIDNLYGNGTTVDSARLFGRTALSSSAYLGNKLRLGFQLSGAPDPTSQTFYDFVNINRGGIHCPESSYAIVRIAKIDAGDYIVGLGQTATVEDESVSIDAASWTDDHGFSLDDLVDNIAAFLRVKGHASLTPQAIAAVQAMTFRTFPH